MPDITTVLTDYFLHGPVPSMLGYKLMYLLYHPLRLYFKNIFKDHNTISVFLPF